MADHIDEANAFAEAHRERAIAAARAAAPTSKPQVGTCNACLDEDAPVLFAGNMLRCTPCRARWEKRQ